MSKIITNFDDFLNEEHLNEDTIKGYKYHFNFEGKKYIIHQGTEDKTIFGIKDKDGEWSVMTKGNLFDPKTNDMEEKEFFEFIQRGIKFFNVRNPVEIDDIKESEWRKFFDYELKKKPGRLNKKYVVLKMHCGKAQSKWHAKHKS